MPPKKPKMPDSVDLKDVVAKHLNKTPEEVEKMSERKNISVPKDALDNAQNAELYDTGEEEEEEDDLDLKEDVKPSKPKSYQEFLKKNKRGKGKVNSPFDFRETFEVELPSRGVPYKGITKDKDILNGKIHMYNMTIHEESIIGNRKYLKDGSVFRRILDNCIASDLDASDLTVFDSNFLMFMLRSQSYDDVLKPELTCVKCDRKFEHEIRISDLAYNKLPEDFKEPIVIELEPKKGVQYKVNCILPRQGIAEEIRQKEGQKRVTKKTARRTRKEENPEDELSEVNLLTRLMYTTVSIEDTNGYEVPKELWKDFFEALPARCIAQLRNETRFETGIDRVNVICPYNDCGEEQEQNIPIDAGFFLFE